MLAISCLCFVPDFIIINYKVILNNIVKPIFKIFYDLTLYLKFERPLLNYFTTGAPPPPPVPSGPKFSNSENCCGSENAMPPKIFWDMEGHRGHFRSKNVFFSKKHILKKIHNKSHYIFNF